MMIPFILEVLDVFARIIYASLGNDFLPLISITEKRISKDRSVSKKRITMSTSAYNTKGDGSPIVP